MTAEQLLKMNERRMRGVRNTLKGTRKYELTEVLTDDYIVLDLHTTGLKPGADRIIQIGAIKYENGEQMAVYQTLINPQRFIPIEVTRSTKITEFLVEEAPFIENEIGNFLSFIDDFPIVTYNASLHMKFLYALEHIKGIQLPRFVVIDTALLARKVLPTLSSQNIKKLTVCLRHTQNPEDIMCHCLAINELYQLCICELK